MVDWDEPQNIGATARADGHTWSQIVAGRDSEIASLSARVAELERERAELGERGDHWRAECGDWQTRAEAADARASALEAEVERLREALNLIDALDPEEHVYGTSHDACRGLVIRMGQTARAALAKEGE